MPFEFGYLLYIVTDWKCSLIDGEGAYREKKRELQQQQQQK